MAIQKTYLNTSDLSTIANWLRTMLVPDYFAAVSYDAEAGTITCTDSDGNTLLTFGTVITAYKSASISVAFTTTTSTFSYAYMCANGALITGSSGSPQIALLISKTNGGKTAIVFTYASGSAGTSYSNNIKRVAWGDVQPDTTQSFTPITANQTQLVPFVTDAALGTVSYTPNAYYIPFGQYYSMGIGKLTIDGTDYLTNGYWAIKDE